MWFIVRIPKLMKTRLFNLCVPAGVIPFMACCAGDGADTASLAAQAGRLLPGDLRPAKVAVVDVREEDLEALPSGEERALAFQRSGRGWSRPTAPLDLPEPDLPEDATLLNGSLLPNIDF